nr:takeout [Spodoptera litura]
MATAILLVTVGLFCFNGVLCAKVQCDFYDVECTTRTAQREYLNFVNGIDGVASSDPLKQDFIESNLPKLKYTIKDGILSGFKNCFIELLRFSKDQTFDNHVRCPQITLNGEYELKGDLLNNYIEGKGTCKVEFYDYRFVIQGNYDANKRDGKTYVYFKSYTLKTDPRGKMIFGFKNLFNGDKQKSDAALKTMNENWKEVDKAMHQQVMEAFIKTYMKNVNDFTNKISAEDILSYEQ